MAGVEKGIREGGAMERSGGGVEGGGVGGVGGKEGGWDKNLGGEYNGEQRKNRQQQPTIIST